MDLRQGKAVAVVSFLVLMGLTIALGSDSDGQEIERRVSATGPAGRTIEREVRRDRAPGQASRELTVRRQGAVAERELSVRQGVGAGAPRGAGFGPGPGPGPAPAGASSVVINRNLYMGGGPPPMPRGGGGTSFGFFLGAPRPVIVPVMPFGPPPTVVVEPYAMPVPAGPAAPPFDPYVDALGRLNSRHGPSRRDGALTLGRIGDPRAVPALVDLLQNDWDSEVRAAAARGLGLIGDPRAARPLEHAATHDRRRDVRSAAAQAIALLPPPAGASVEALATPPTRPADPPTETTAAVPRGAWSAPSTELRVPIETATLPELAPPASELPPLTPPASPPPPAPLNSR